MHATDRFHLVAGQEDAQESKLIVDGRVIGLVNGCVLEAQYQCSRGFLIVTADGNPYEETLHFLLVDEEMTLVDRVSLGRIYNSGTFSNVTSAAADELEFSFFGSERWRLTVMAEPQRIRPRLVGSVSYPAGALKRHWLRLEKVRG